MRFKYFKKSPSGSAYFSFSLLNVYLDFAALSYMSSIYFIPLLYHCEYVIVLPSTFIFLLFHKISCL